jgi:hypothetical protein
MSEFTIRVNLKQGKMLLDLERSFLKWAVRFVYSVHLDIWIFIFGYSGPGRNLFSNDQTKNPNLLPKTLTSPYVCDPNAGCLKTLTARAASAKLGARVSRIFVYTGWMVGTADSSSKELFLV